MVGAVLGDGESRRKEGEMIGNVWSNGKHSRLRLETSDLEEFLVRCGWTAIHDIEGITDEARGEIARLEALPYIEGTETGYDWWATRLISNEAALTPDV